MSVAERADEKVDLRCPQGPKALLGKMVQRGEPQRVHVDRESNLMEIACRDCTKQGRQKDPGIRRVLHRFNVIGEFVESVVER